MEAIRNSKQQTRTSVIVVETDYHDRVAEYGSWWDVPIAEVSEVESVQQAQRHYAKARQRERYFLAFALMAPSRIPREPRAIGQEELY